MHFSIKVILNNIDMQIYMIIGYYHHKLYLLILICDNFITIW